MMISNKFLRIASFSLSLAVLLSGCAGVNRVALNKAPQKTETRLIIPSDEIIVRSEPSNISAAMGGGLIPALIDASITASRQTKLEEVSNPFYTETSDIDLRGIFGKEFESVFNSQKTLPNTNLVITSRSLTKKTMDELQTNLGSGESLLAIRSWFEFSSDAKNVIVITSAFMAEQEKKEPVYRNTIFFLSKPANNTDGASPLTYWSANKGEMLKKVYAESASKIAKLYIEDLNAPSNEVIKTKYSEKDKTKVSIPTFNQQFLFTPLNGVVNLSEGGFVVEEDDSKKIIRGESGALYWIEK